MLPQLDRPPEFSLRDMVRSRLDPSCGYIVTALVVRESHYQYLCADPDGVETIRQACELELGNREKDPVAVE